MIGKRAEFLPCVMAEELLHIMAPIADFQIGLALELDGGLDPETLRQSLLRALDLYPHLSCAFVPGWQSARMERLAVSGEEVLTVAAPPHGGKSAEKTLLDFFSKPLDPFKGPLLSCLLIQGPTDTLCLKLSHLAADAGGVKAFAYCLAGLVRSRTRGGPEPAPPPDFTRSTRQIARQFTSRGKLKILKRTVDDIARNPVLPGPFTLPGAKAPIRERGFVVKTLGPDLCRAMAGWGRERNATLNDLCMAAFLRAMEAHTPDRRDRAPRIITTADLRRHLPREKRQGLVCNLSGWVPVSLPETGPNLDSTTREVSFCMNRLKKESLGLGALPLAAALVKPAPLAVTRGLFAALARVLCPRRLVAPSLTNMGRVDHAALDFGDTACRHAWLLPPIVYAPVMGVGISGYRDTLTLSMGYTAPGFDALEVDRFMDSVVRELEAGIW